MKTRKCCQLSANLWFANFVAGEVIHVPMCPNSPAEEVVEHWYLEEIRQQVRWAIEARLQSEIVLWCAGSQFKVYVEPGVRGTANTYWEAVCADQEEFSARPLANK